MDWAYPDLPGHEGYPGRRLAADLPGGPLWDGAPWRRGQVVAWDEADGLPLDIDVIVAACTCGWTGTPIAATVMDAADALHARAQNAWNREHAAALLADTIPDELSHRAHRVLEDIAELADTRPLAMLALLTELARGGDQLASQAVRAAVLTGATWDEIATATATTSQAAHRRWAHTVTEPGPPDGYERS